MAPSIAALVFTIGIIGLFYLDRDNTKRVSISLWVPTIWLFFCLSRSLSAWLGLNPTADRSLTYTEGSPIDAALFAVLEVLALIVLLTRGMKVVRILRSNWAIVLFFFYAGLSMLWSDYPVVTLKHWTKGVGDLMMVLIVLTEPNVSDAIERLFTRLGFVLLPLSILFIKYYPQLGRVLTLSWTMEPVGVAQQKNSLGELCDFVGLVLLWRLRSAFNYCEGRERVRHMVALSAVLAMVVWLLWVCNSMTSIGALVMASTVMLLSARPAFRRNPAWVHITVVALLTVTIYGLFFQSSGEMIQSMGRNPTLTGRTDIWKVVLGIPTNRLIGAGYESFWLGSRLQEMWRAFPGLQLNESHNGYIEITITLGWIGAALLGVLIVTGYRNVIGWLHRDRDLGSLKTALFLSVVVTGLTEAAFRMMGPPWIFFLLASAAPPFVARRNLARKSADQTTRSFAEEPDAASKEVAVGYRMEPALARSRI